MTTARKKRMKTILRRALALLFTLAALGQNTLFPALPTARAADTSIKIFRWHKLTGKWGDNALTRDRYNWHRVMVVGHGTCGEWMLNPTRSTTTDGYFVLYSDTSSVANYPWYDEYRSGIDFFSIGAMDNMAYHYTNGDEGGSSDDWVFCLSDWYDDARYGLTSDETTFTRNSDYTLTPYRIDERNSGFRIYHYDKGGYDEDWYFKDGKWWLDERDKDDFYMWEAQEYTARQIDTHASEIINGQVTVYGQPLAYIPSGMTLTVRSGGVLVITGALLNDGNLVIEDGGMLILKNNSTIVPFTRTNKNAGGITSKGTVIIQTNAKLIGGGVNGIQINGGSVTNFGLMMSECFQVKRSYLVENKSTGKVIAGYSVGLNYRSKVLGDACDNSGKDTITTTTPVSEITASNYSSYTRTDLSDSQRRINIADNGVYGGSLWSRGNNVKSYELAVYEFTGYGLFNSYMQVFSGMSSDIEVSKTAASPTTGATVTFSDAGSGAVYKLSAFSDITINIKKDSGWEQLYKGYAGDFDPATLNHLT